MSLSSSPLIHIQEVCTRFPNGRGKPRSRDTVVRWMTLGCKIPGQSAPIRLRGCRVGSAWYTTAEALDEFTQALTDAVLEDSPSSRSSSPRISIPAAETTARAQGPG